MELDLSYLKRIVVIEVLGVELWVWLNSATVCFEDIDRMKRREVFLSRGFGLYLID